MVKEFLRKECFKPSSPQPSPPTKSVGREGALVQRFLAYPFLPTLFVVYQGNLDEAPPLFPRFLWEERVGERRV